MEPGPAQLSRAVADAARHLDHWIGFHRELDRLPGVQVAVLHDGDLALSRAYGIADLSTGEALTTDHRFRIASHSKTFTATAIMRLVQDGRLRLDDTVGAHVPDVVGPIGHVTVRELLAHGGGVVRDGWDGDHWQLRRVFPDRNGLLAVAADDADVLARNERFKYSNIGYSLLGLVIEAVTGTPYADHVATALIEPLGLTSTAADVDPAAPGDQPLATGHTAIVFDGRRIPIDHIGTGAMASATGFVSRAEDVVRWAAAHFPGDERILDDDTKRQMQRTEWCVISSANGEYALGFAVTTINDRRLLGHGGGFPGQITHTLFDPSAKLAVSVLTNVIDGSAQSYAANFYRFVDLAMRHEPDPTALELATFTGRFATLWGVYDIVDLGGTLWYLDAELGDPTADPFRLEVVDADTLCVVEAPGYASPGERFVYTRDADGQVASVRGGSGNAAVPFETLRTAMAAADRVRIDHHLL